MVCGIRALPVRRVLVKEHILASPRTFAASRSATMMIAANPGHMIADKCRILRVDTALKLRNITMKYSDCQQMKLRDKAMFPPHAPGEVVAMIESGESSPLYLYQHWNYLEKVC
jgi:hypothetical protein